MQFLLRILIYILAAIGVWHLYLLYVQDACLDRGGRWRLTNTCEESSSDGQQDRNDLRVLTAELSLRR